jgi:hypothetical protein
MGRPRGTFSKRDREMKLKERAKAKADRLAARRAEIRTTKGPPIEAADPIAPPANSDASDADALPGEMIAETE